VVEEAGVPGENTDHGQATGKLDHLRMRVECTLFVIYKYDANPSVLVIGLYELLGNPTTQIVQETCFIRDTNCLLFPGKIAKGEKSFKISKG
jgi:hypothetical protein